MDGDKIQAYKDSLPPLQDLVPGLGPEKNGECHGGCPSCGSTAGSDRFWVSTTGKYAGKCKCRMDGCAFYKGADIIDYIEITTGCDLATQMKEAGFLGDGPTRQGRTKPAKKGSTATPAPVNPEEDLSALPSAVKPLAAKKNTASFIWNKSKAASEIPYDYLEKTRKLKLERNTEIRFNSYTDKEKILHEMIVLRMSRPGDDPAEPQSIQRIFIKKSDGGWVKTGSAICNSIERAAVGRGVWFCPGMPSREIAVGEGPETMISVGLATSMNYVACLTDSGIKSIQLPKETEDVYFFIDQDAALGKHGGPGFAGQKSGLTAARRAEKQGKRAFVVTPTEDTFSENPEKIDFNDLWKADQTGQSIRDRLALAVPVGDIDWRPPRRKKKDVAGGEYPEGTLELLEELNGEYAACMLSGKFRILTETISYVISDKGTNSVEFIEKGSWFSYLENRTCKVFVGEYKAVKDKSLADVWMKWEGRRSYRAVSFDPSNSLPDDTYNLFRGLPIKPVKGKWGKFKNHMFSVLCGGNNKYYLYLMAWMARCVQDPGGRKPGVAIVLVGGKGTGKGTFAREFGELFGESFVHVSSSKALVGDFNIHFASCVIAFADEAHWGQDHKAEGMLKALITERLILFTPKGVDSMNMKSHVNLIMASNERSAIPASPDERRFFVLEAKWHSGLTTEYFQEIYKELRSGGTEAMMEELLNYDYSGIDLTKAPKTDGLADQVEASLSNTLEFWHAALERGYLLSSRDSGAPVITNWRQEDGSEYSFWPEKVWKYEVTFEYEDIFGKRKKFLDPGNTFWKETREFWGDIEMKRLTGNGKRGMVISVPSLEIMRSSFTDHTGIVFSGDDRESPEKVPF